MNATRLIICGCLLAVLAACGGQNTAGTNPPTTSTTPTPPTGTATSGSSSPAPTASTEPAAGTRCTAADLTGAVQNEEGAAGNRYAMLVVTNKGSRTCTLFGHGGLQLIGVGGGPNPTNQVRTENPGPSPVTLRPGQSASKKLHWVAVATGNEPGDGPCQPPSAGLKVIPPDETEQFTVTHDFGSVCDQGRIEDSAYFTA